jgi:hypothetical protein
VSAWFDERSERAVRELWRAVSDAGLDGSLHERVHRALGECADGEVEPHLPGRWEPHCTLAWRLEDRVVPAVVSLLLDTAAVPLEATITQIGPIDTPAEVEIGSFPL